MTVFEFQLFVCVVIFDLINLFFIFFDFSSGCFYFFFAIFDFLNIFFKDNT